jgi:TIR domain
MASARAAYSRSASLTWIKHHFCPILSLRVGQELDVGKVDIFLDEQIESGSSWPHDLVAKLGQSRILVPLWSKNYFNSQWCVLELSHMLAREDSMGMRTAAKPGGLIGAIDWDLKAPGLERYFSDFESLSDGRGLLPMCRDFTENWKR